MAFSDKFIMDLFKKNHPDLYSWLKDMEESFGSGTKALRATDEKYDDYIHEVFKSFYKTQKDGDKYTLTRTSKLIRKSFPLTFSAAKEGRLQYSRSPRGAGASGLSLPVNVTRKTKRAAQIFNSSDVKPETFASKSAEESVLLGDNSPSDIPGLTWKQKEDANKRIKANKLEKQRHELAISHSTWARKRDQILAARQYGKDYSRVSMTDDERFIADYKEKQMAMGVSEFDAEGRARSILSAKNYVADQEKQKKASDNFAHDMLDKFDQRMEDLTEYYGGGSVGKQRADAALRKEVLKDLPGIFKNSNLDTKRLYEISKTIHSVPFAGKFMKSPVSLGIGAVCAAKNFMNHQEEAMKTIVAYNASKGYFGSPSKDQEKRLLQAGVDITQIPSVIGERKAMMSQFQMGVGTEKFGNAAKWARNATGYDKFIAAAMSGDMNSFMSEAYNIASQLGDGDRINFLKEFGISQEEFNAEKIKRTGSDFAQRVLERKQRFKMGQEQAFASSNPISWASGAIGEVLSWTGLPQLGFRIGAAKDGLFGDSYDRANEAAESLKNAEAVGNGGDTSNTTNNNQQTSCTIQNITLDAGKSEALVAALGNALSGQGGLSVLDWANNYNGSRVA